MKDTPDTNVHFIQMIERNPCVYNHRCQDYSNKSKQEAAWAAIAKKFDATVPECKERWKNLRACFTRYLKIKAKPGYTVVVKKPYYLAKHLNFLTPFTRTRTEVGKPSVPPPSSFSKHTFHQEIQDFTQSNLSENEHHNNNESIIMDEDDDDPNIQDSSDTNFTQTDSRSLTSIAKKPMVIINKQWIDTEDTNANDTIDEKAFVKVFTKQKTTDTKNNDEDLDLCFFKSLLPDIRQMNPDQKRRFKVGVINLSGSILNEEATAFFHSMKREYQHNERPNTVGLCKTDRFRKSAAVNQSTQYIPQEEVPSTSNYCGNLQFHDTESRPNSAQSILSSDSSVVEYKINPEELEPSIQSDL